MLVKIIISLIIALLVIPTASAELPAESAEISYQVEHSDRIVIGTVTEIQSYYDYSIITVEAHEWLMNPISSPAIKIKTGIGTNLDTEDEARFSVNETAILMLKETDLESNAFRVAVGEPGKHPLSDKDAITNEILKLQASQSYRTSEDGDGVEYLVLEESYDGQAIMMIIQLVAFLVSIVFVVALVKKRAHKPDSRKTYLTFFMIGILTFYLSGFILRGIHPPESIFLMFLIYFILFEAGVLASGEKSGMFIAKAFSISFAALVIISVLFFAMGAYSHMNSKEIDAYLLQEEPEEFVAIKEEELDSYPALKEAIETQSYVDASTGEWERTIKLLNGTSAVKYKEEYYGIGFITA
ncbi:hypothetical protein V7O62_00190 [Methanolobus sp. ZRKC2]|uniref:hypothetical protein n=1 Tax=Methanolobus sp. ZRKC2 TaxID=3125783 RepID=UPI00324926B2